MEDEAAADVEDETPYKEAAAVVADSPCNKYTT